MKIYPVHQTTLIEGEEIKTIEDDVRAASTKFYTASNRMLNGDPVR
jgi:hypothetical protein